MWESRKRLKSADRYVRITVLLIILFTTSIFLSNLTNENESLKSDNQHFPATELETHSHQTEPLLELSGTNSPVVTTFAGDKAYTEGNGIQSKLKWKISDAPDDEEDKYLIYQNGTVVQNGTYLANVFIEIFVNQLERGVYNFTVYGNDTDGNFVTDTAYVTVTDVAAPIIDMVPVDFNTTEISTGNDIFWRGNDLHPSSYRILRYSTEVTAGLWNSSDEIISHNIDHLLNGIYNFTIEMFDDSGNWVNDTITIHVTDKASPVVLSSTDPLVFSEWDTDRYLVVNVTDNHPDSYQIFRDGLSVFNGTWSNSQLITWKMDHLDIGTYNFSILLVDQFSNNITIYIDVEIYEILLKETVVPSIIVAAEVHEGDYETIQSNWKDILSENIENGSVTVSLYQGQTMIDQTYYLNKTNNLGNFDLTLNYTGLASSDYRWEILIEKLFYVSQTVEFNITVLPHLYAISVTPLADLTQGEEYEIEVTITYANSQSGLSLNSLTQNTGTASGVDVDFEMLVTLLGGGQQTISKSGTSNANGKVTFTLSIFETSIIASVDSMNIQTVDDQFSNPTSIDLPVGQFPVIISTGTQSTSSGTTSGTTDTVISSNTVTETQTDDNSSNQFQIIEDYLIFILAGLFGFFIFLFLIRKLGKSKKQKTEDLQDVYDLSLAEVMGISTIQLVMLVSKSGIPLYERHFKTMGVDTILLSGVTSAISSLLSEANDQQIFGLEIMENRGLSITSHKAANSSLLFISSTSIPMTILSQMIEAHEAIEKKYGDKLIDDVSGFVAPEDINKIFRDHNLKLDLSSDIEIDLFALDKFHSDGKTKNGIKLLAGVLLDVDLKELEMHDVGRLVDIFEENGFDRNYAANFILHAYREGMIKSKIK